MLVVDVVAGWHEQWPFDSWWNCWDYRARVPNLQPTHSGTSAATAHTCGVSLDDLASPPGVLKVPVHKEQILYVQEKDGRWKLNSKISPIDGIPE